MNRLPLLPWSLTSVAAAILLSACGGGSTPGASLPATSDDDPDAATMAQVAGILGTVDAALAEHLPAAGEAPPSPETPVDKAQALGVRAGAYPGLVQTNLVANKPGYGAQIVEPALRNAWGIAIRPAGAGGHFWVGAERTGQSIQYVGDVGGTPLFQDELKVVDTGGPVTGVAFNPGTGFVITQPHAEGPITNPAKFFFANASGTISAWTERARPEGSFDHPADSVTVVDARERRSSFLGVTVAHTGDRMFAADFGAEAALRVFDGQFNEQPPVPNPFAGRSGSGASFEAFNVQAVGDRVFAMYGRHVAPGTTPPPEDGRLAEFDAEGRLVATWRGRGLLNYPWGVARAPDDFGLYSGCLLVGNFGDGTVVAFHPKLKVALDYVRNEHGERVRIDGLWGLQFGNGASLGTANHLYFAAGPNREEDGLFGKLQANPGTAPVLSRLSLCR